MAERTEALVRALEGIGAAVESERAGEACFGLDGLRGIYGSRAGVLAATRRAAVAALGEEPALGSGPTRFGAYLDACELSARSAPVAVLADRLGAGELVEALERLGIETLAELARISPD
ncbi:MAG TPA: hypothetical protein VK889_00065, partial [Solirubrobacterales bacterium]|nr:hypothetical protein [Solirubrobacterales bacterium]